MEYALADTGVWYGMFDNRDERYREAQSKVDLFDFFRIVIPWPTVYETLRTRFVRNKVALQQFEIFLKSHHDIVFLNDDIYRNDAFDLAIESSLRRGRPLSMVDCLLRLVIDDPNTQINYLLPEFCTHTALAVHAREIFEMDQIYCACPQAAVSTDEESNLKQNCPTDCVVCIENESSYFHARNFVHYLQTYQPGAWSIPPAHGLGFNLFSSMYFRKDINAGVRLSWIE